MMRVSPIKSFFFLSILLFGGCFAFSAYAQSATESFFVESSHDVNSRSKIEARLVRSSKNAHFYVEKSWWEKRSAQQQNDLRIALFELGQEFDNRMYPTLTATFGSEPNPGVDGDGRITILFHPMKDESGGYFNSGDVYTKLQNPKSNEKEMLYLNTKYLGGDQVKSFLAHEFTHLITIEQKDLSRRVTEEVWLNEARAEYAPTLLEYDSIYEESNLQRRFRDFLENPSNPLTEWLDRKEDYGVVNMFTQYLVDHYGVQILVDSLHSSSVGIPSLNEALEKNGFEEDFSDIFRSWVLAVLVNDCSLGERYCYKSEGLERIRITPVSYFIPGGQTVFSTFHETTPWSANWHRLVGGEKKLGLNFDGANSGDFEVPYVFCDLQEICSVEFLALNKEQEGEVTFSQFNKAQNSLTLIPFLVGGDSGISGIRYSFSWEVSVQGEEQEETAQVNNLLARIAQLQAQVRQLQAQLAAAVTSPAPVANKQDSNNTVSCQEFQTDLSFGQSGEQVRCLQEFLKAQGPDVYPEGLVTGYFGSLTRQAVRRFQERYAQDILAPLGLSGGTGYFGLATRAKANQLL